MNEFLLGMATSYALIGVIQLIINSIADDSEAPLYLTCFWLIPVTSLVNYIRRIIKKNIKKPKE